MPYPPISGPGRVSIGTPGNCPESWPPCARAGRTGPVFEPTFQSEARRNDWRLQKGSSLTGSIRSLGVVSSRLLVNPFSRIDDLLLNLCRNGWLSDGIVSGRAMLAWQKNCARAKSSLNDGAFEEIAGLS
jgi:hypothetical protein